MKCPDQQNNRQQSGQPQALAKLHLVADLATTTYSQLTHPVNQYLSVTKQLPLFYYLGPAQELGLTRNFCRASRIHEYPTATPPQGYDQSHVLQVLLRTLDKVIQLDPSDESYPQARRRLRDRLQKLYQLYPLSHIAHHAHTTHKTLHAVMNDNDHKRSQTCPWTMLHRLQNFEATLSHIGHQRYNQRLQQRYLHPGNDATFRLPPLVEPKQPCPNCQAPPLHLQRIQEHPAYEMPMVRCISCNREMLYGYPEDLIIDSNPLDHQQRKANQPCQHCNAPVELLSPDPGQRQDILYCASCGEVNHLTQ